MRTISGLLVLFAAAMASAQTQELTDALRDLRQSAPHVTSTVAAPLEKEWIGPCNYQDLPFIGYVTESSGTFAAWGGTYDLPHAETCLSSSTTGGSNWHKDVFRVPIAPGDVVDIVFVGAYQTYVAVADYDPTGTYSGYLNGYATIAGTGSNAGKYIVGFQNVTVPATWTLGYLDIRVEDTASQLQYTVGVVNHSVVQPSSCTASTMAMCLNNARFQVSADWQKPTGESGQGTAVSLTADTGYFWFFSATNVEMVVKVLDGCGINAHQWVFAGGLTNVAVTLTVTDTQTGTQHPYHNPQGQALVPIQDTSAFTCP